MILLSWRHFSQSLPRFSTPPIGGVAIRTLPTRPTFLVGEIRSAFERFRNDELCLVVEPGAVLRPPLPALAAGGWDLAAHVVRIGAAPVRPGAFDGLGRIDLRTLAIRRSPAAERVLRRWEDWTRTQSKTDPEALLLALSDIREAAFLHLPPEYVWEESAMRALHPRAEPRIEWLRNGHRETASIQSAAVPAIGSAVPEPPSGPRAPEVLWCGHLYDASGFAKMNRELIHRVANSVSVRLDGTHAETSSIGEYETARLDALKGTLIGPRAPLLRVFGPDFETGPPVRRRIVYTMMETAHIHSDFVRLVNERFDEAIVPTEWNRGVLVESGVRIPVRTIPLGVDTLVYRIRTGKVPLPPCRQISGPETGRTAAPDGFVFLSVGLPSARKGFGALVEAAELAFGGRDDVHVVLAVTHSLDVWNREVYRQFTGRRVRVWTLEGRFGEHGMARIYAGADCYVSASRGEGFNLPAAEAAAVGLPVIVPDNSAHREIFGEGGWLFPCGPAARCPEVESVSPWYVGMPFATIGPDSIRELADRMRKILAGGQEVRRQAAVLTGRMYTDWTWERAAERLTLRLLEAQP